MNLRIRRADLLDLDAALLTTSITLAKEGRGVYVRFSGGQQFRVDAEGTAPGSEPATDKQTAYIQRLCDEKQQVHPDGPLTTAQASDIIDSLHAGTYDPKKWVEVPF